MKLRAIATACALSAAFLGAAGAASAQDASFNVAVTSDYIFRGVSQTDKDPALQAGVDFATSGGWYGGAWGSNVDFADGTNTEVDIYGGYRFEAKGFNFDLGVVSYTYLGTDAGLSDDTVELKAGVSRAFGPASLGAVVYYSPESWGTDTEALYYEVNGGYAVTDKLSLSAAVGHQGFDPGTDYTTWNIGGTYALTSVLGLDVRYHDTNLSGLDEYYVVSLKATF